jgi:hypothetical protein
MAMKKITNLPPNCECKAGIGMGLSTAQKILYCELKFTPQRNSTMEIHSCEWNEF